MNFRSLRIHRSENKCVPVFSVLCLLELHPRDECSTEVLNLSVRLRIVFGSRLCVYTELCACSCKILNVNCGPFSIRTFVEMVNLLTECSMKVVATTCAVVSIVGIALDYFENLSVIIVIY